MMRSKRWLVAIVPVAVPVALLGGCGAILTGAVAGGVIALSGGGKGSSTLPSTVLTASVPATNPNPTISVSFTIANPGNRASTVEIRFSATASGRQPDSDQQPFPVRSLPDPGPSGLATADPTSPIANDASLLASASGSSYVFVWSAAKDLGARLYQNEVRLQILLDGVPAFTLAPFSVDNTNAPVVTMVAPDPSALPAGATTYADAQTATSTAAGYVPVKLTVMDAQGSNVSLQVLFATASTNGFQGTNVAAGQLVDASSGLPVPLDSVPASVTGTAYSFHFESSLNGVGTGMAPVASAALQFTPTATKTGASVASTSFAVNNTAFSAVPSTPAGPASAGFVTLAYDLFDQSFPKAVPQGLNVTFEYSLTGSSGTFFPCSELHIPSSDGTTSLAGLSHTFQWNAYSDIVANGLQSAVQGNVVLEVFVTRPTTGVVAGPFRTQKFSIDQRLMTTYVGRTGTASDSSPIAVAFVKNDIQGRNILYFADSVQQLVKALDVTNPAAPTLTTVMGGGGQVLDGALATDFKLRSPTSVAAAPDAFFVCATDTALGRSVTQLFRVDRATPVVLTLVGLGDIADNPSLVCFDATGGGTLFYALETNFPNAGLTPPFHEQISSIPEVGGVQTPLVGASASGAGSDPSDTNVANGNVLLGPILGIATDMAAYPNLVFFIDLDPRGANFGQTRLRVANLSGSADTTFQGMTLAAGTTSTLQVGLAFTGMVGVSIEGKNKIDVTLTIPPSVVRIDDTLGVTSLAGFDFGFLGDGGPATNADVLGPRSVSGDGAGGIYFADAGNGRVRQVSRTGTITTVAGTFPFEGDPSTSTAGLPIPGMPAATAAFAFPSSVAVYQNGFIVADRNLSRIRFFDTLTNQMSTIAGSGLSGIAGDGLEPATLANVGLPDGLCTGASGEIYVSQLGESVVRKIATDPSTGLLVASTVAGIISTTAPRGVLGITADGPLPQPLFSPRALAFQNGAILVPQPRGAPGVVGEPAYGCLTAINPGAGSVTVGGPGGATVNAGSALRIAGAAAGGTVLTPSSPSGIATLVSLSAPTGVCVAPSGAIFICDSGTAAVYKLAGTTLTLIAGTPTMPGYSGDGGAATAALLGEPVALCLDPAGNGLYIMDAFVGVIRIVNMGGATASFNGVSVGAGKIATVAGSTSSVALGDLGSALFAKFDFGGPPQSIAAGSNMLTLPNGTLVFPETGTGRIRQIDATGLLTTLAGGLALDGDGDAADSATLTAATAIGMRSDGTLLLADYGRIREVPQVSPIVTRTVGNGYCASGGDGGPALFASIAHLESAFYASNFPNASLSVVADVTSDANGPRAIADSNGTAIPGLMAIADTITATVRIVNRGSTPASLATSGAPLVIAPGAIATYPFPGAIGSLAQPEGVCFTSDGLLIVSDTLNARILAANITSATLHGIAAGNTVAVVSTARPHQVASPPVSAVGGPFVVFTARAPLFAYAAVLNLGSTPASPYGLAAAIPPGGTAAITPTNLGQARGIATDSTTGDAYFAIVDANQVWRVGFTTGTYQLVAGNSLTIGGYNGDDGIPQNALLNRPIGVTVDPWGSVYILDAGNKVVRRCRKFP